MPGTRRTNAAASETMSSRHAQAAPSKTTPTQRRSRPAKIDIAAGTNAEPASTPERGVSKIGRLLALLEREGGASIDELCEATGWQRHSVRGALVGALKRKGHVITSAKHEGLRRYHIGAAS